MTSILSCVTQRLCPLLVSHRAITCHRHIRNAAVQYIAMRHYRIHCHVVKRNYSFTPNLGSKSPSASAAARQQSLDRVYYLIGLSVLAVGVSFASVPLYRAFCQATGYAGTTMKAEDFERIEKMKRIDERLLCIKFTADTHAAMQWKFKPQQDELWLSPGETALAFYTATNPTDRPIVGISTYNIVPFDAGLYFAKIQCFCFEEQILNPGEQVDMPVFFYIDPDFVEDPKMEHVNEIVLSYTFFESKAGLQLPQPLSRNED